MTWIIYKKAPPLIRRGLGWIVYMSGTAASLSLNPGFGLFMNKKKPNPYRIRLEEAATYSPT